MHMRRRETGTLSATIRIAQYLLCDLLKRPHMLDSEYQEPTLLQAGNSLANSEEEQSNYPALAPEARNAAGEYLKDRNLALPSNEDP